MTWSKASPSRQPSGPPASRGAGDYDPVKAITITATMTVP
jgi:hypothetical protein